MEEKVLSREEIISSKILIGCRLEQIKEILGCWWVCISTKVNTATGKGVHIFNRVGNGQIEIHTDFVANRRNIVMEVR
jgi:hypothetical protein